MRTKKIIIKKNLSLWSWLGEEITPAADSSWLPDLCFKHMSIPNYQSYWFSIMAQMEVVVALCLPSGDFALSLLVRSKCGEIQGWCGFGAGNSFLGRNEDHHCWLKQQNAFLWGWMCCWGQCREVWHEEIVAINTEAVWSYCWHESGVFLNDVGRLYFKWEQCWTLLACWR